MSVHREWMELETKLKTKREIKVVEPMMLNFGFLFPHANDVPKANPELRTLI